MKTLAIALSLTLLGCATQKVAGECPQATKIKCLTEKICSLDKRRGCMVCQCRSVDFEHDQFSPGPPDESSPNRPPPIR